MEAEDLASSEVDELRGSAAVSGFSSREIVQDLMASGLTLVDIARTAGVREPQVQNWAAGTSRPQNDNSALSGNRVQSHDEAAAARMTEAKEGDRG